MAEGVARREPCRAMVRRLPAKLTPIDLSCCLGILAFAIGSTAPMCRRPIVRSMMLKTACDGPF
jgi:hypothetical protein